MSIVVTIDGEKYKAEENQTILNVCEKNGIYIPTLCYHPDLQAEGRCRICIVKANNKTVTSCNTYVRNEMNVITNDDEIKNLRKTIMDLMLSNCPEALETDENELIDVAKKMNFKKVRFSPHRKKPSDDSSYSIVFDNNKCILCGRCIQKCQNIQEVFAIAYRERGYHATVSPYMGRNLIDTVCIYCGQCSLACPASAIVERDYTEEVLNAINDPQKHVVVQTAPSIRASIGETQDMPAGSKVTGKLVTALKTLGFDRVFDTDFGADLTIIEEGIELIDRIQNKKILPLITSCSPGWILCAEHFYHDLLLNVSTCKSPQQMTGALIKSYYAQKNNIDPRKIVSVAVMPCTAKKFEAHRPEMRSSGYQDVDFVLTTREMGKMIRKANIDFKNLDDTPFDSLMGISTGAGVIFAVTGGVMEAALRFAVEKLEGKKLGKIDYTEVRGLKGIKEASLKVVGLTLNVAVAHGTGNAHRLLSHVRENPSKYHMIEIMACEGGCIGGGGQPIPTTWEIIKKRTTCIYDTDKSLEYRKSQDNPEIEQAYRDFLGEPGGKKAHQYLHTHYNKKVSI